MASIVGGKPERRAALEFFFQEVTMRAFFIKSCLVALLTMVTPWVFPAGTKEQAPSKPAVVTFHRFSTAAHQAYILPLIAAFEKKHPEVKIESVEHSVPGYEALAQKILLSFASGSPADVGQTGYTLVRTMVESGKAIALDETLKGDASFDRNALYKSMMDLGTVDGKLYMLPLGTSTPIMYYNVDAFKKAGLDPQKPPKTWVELKTAARKLKEAGYEGVLWGWSITGNWIFQTMLENLGGRIASPDAKSVDFAGPEGEKALSYIRELVEEGLMPVTKDLVATFTSGKLGILIESTFQRVAIPQKSSFEVRLAPIPTPNGDTPKVVAGGNGVMMHTQDKKLQKETLKFMKYIVTEEAGFIVAENSGYLPAARGAVATLRKKYPDDRNYSIVLDQIERVTPWFSWPGKYGTEIQKILMDMQESVFLGKISPRDGLNQAAEKIKKLL